MKFGISSLLVTFILLGCVTVKEEAPIVLTENRGAVAFDASMFPIVADHNFAVQFIALDPSTGLALESQPEELKFISFRHDQRTQGPSIQLIVRELPPGDYAVALIDARASSSSSGLGSFGLISLIATATIEGAQGADKSGVRFVSSNGIPTENAPKFNIHSNTVTYIGNLVFNANYEQHQVPKLDPDGSWDGQSTDIVPDKQVFMFYDMSPKRLSRHAQRLNAAIYQSEAQILTPLLGEKFIVKDFQVSD